MQHQQGEDRNQMFMFSLEGAIAPDSFVRKKENVPGKVGLMFMGYYLTRCASIVGVEKLINI